MVEAITYIAARLFSVVGLWGALNIWLEYDLISALYRLSTTFAKFLFVTLSRNHWMTLLPSALRSLYAMLVGLQSTRGSR